jgi:hypothetical protein
VGLDTVGERRAWDGGLARRRGGGGRHAGADVTTGSVMNHDAFGHFSVSLLDAGGVHFRDVPVCTSAMSAERSALRSITDVTPVQWVSTREPLSSDGAMKAGRISAQRLLSS